jgi:hypothetical protein
VNPVSQRRGCSGSGRDARQKLNGGNHCIREVVHSTGYIITVAGNGTAGNSGDGAAATAAQLNTPHGVASRRQRQSLHRRHRQQLSPSPVKVMETAWLR